MKVSARDCFSILGSVVQTIVRYPIVLFSFVIVVFLQLWMMEILFFAPRPPLLLFFKPIIARLAGEAFLHYPMNFVLLDRWFQNLQIPFFIFINSLFSGIIVAMVARINSDQPIVIKDVFKKALSKYVHLVCAAGVMLGSLYVLSLPYALMVRRAVRIRSTSGIYFLIKKIVILGAPYANLIFSICVTAIFAFFIPIIIIEGKNVFKALWENFCSLKDAFVGVFLIMFVSSLFYLPFLILKSNAAWVRTTLSPEVWQVVMALGVVVLVLIDTIQYAAATLCYLIKKDNV